MMRNIVILLLIGAVTCNLWDNIFSQMRAKSPILLSQSIQFHFPINYQGIQMKGKFDFNRQLSVITVQAIKQIFVVKIQLFRLQIDLKTLIVTVEQILQGCSRYTIEGLAQYKLSDVDLEKYQSKIYLINVLFQWIDQITIKKTIYDQYVMKPDLFTGHLQAHQPYQQNPLVLVDQLGQIYKIYQSDEKQKQIPFENRSSVAKKLECANQLEVVKRQQLKGLIGGLLKDRGITPQNYQKYDFQDIFNL